MEGNNVIWLVSVKSADRRLLVISEQCVKVGDVVRIKFESVIDEPMLGEVIAEIQTERGSELYKWIIAASEQNLTRRSVDKVWTICPA